MKMLKRTPQVPFMALDARTAADLMTPNPLSIGCGMSILDAANFLATRGMIAAPVIDEAGRPVGILKSSDIRKHKGQRAKSRAGSPVDHGPLTRPEFSEVIPWDDADHRSTVSDIMNQAIYCVRPETSAAEVVEKMLALKVRRIFVVDGLGILIGAITTYDMLRELRRWSANVSLDVSV